MVVDKSNKIVCKDRIIDCTCGNIYIEKLSRKMQIVESSGDIAYFKRVQGACKV